MPMSEKRARLLLSRRRAIVVKMYPFTIRLKDRIGGEIQSIRIKIDPGSKHTGLAIVRENKIINATESEDQNKLTVLNLFQINHRGRSINANLISRRLMRRRRRTNLRYRKARFNNRIKKEGWLPPSLQHRVDTVTSWISKLINLAPITGISMELVRFDMQKMEDPEISGMEYQQGQLEGYEVREYLLEKWNRKCSYCNAREVPLEVEHIVPKSRGGSNRINNLTLACRSCNEKKGNRSIETFLLKKPELLQKIQTQAKKPLKDATAVNSTRLQLAGRLKATHLPTEFSSGGKTKFNRMRLSIPKTHALDAACVGATKTLEKWNIPTLEINCMGRGSYQRTRLDKYGFPRGYLMRQKSVKGFQTGDHVKAYVFKGKKIGNYTGRVAVRSSGNFNITTKEGIIQGINYTYCKLTSRSDGYGYEFQPKTQPITEERRFLPVLKDEVSTSLIG